MLRIKDIQDSFIHLIGWQQSYDANDFVISENLTQSESGMYYQDIHPLLTLQNLACIAPDFKNYEYPEHSQFKEYPKGVVVKKTSDDETTTLYKSLKNVPFDTEIENTEYWIETNPFSEWLEQKTKASIIKGLNRFINEKASKGTFRALCENKTLFDGTGRIYDVIKNRNNVVGFEIVPVRSKGVTTKINKIGLQFTSAGTYTIYIFHSSSIDPIYTLPFTKQKENTLEWFVPSQDIFLPYESEQNDAGGSWYICYVQSKLPEGSQAIRKDRDWSKGPCKACTRHEFESWKAWSRYLEVHPFYVNEEVTESNEETLNLWDIETNQYLYDTNFGLNLDITVACDITDFIIAEKMSFVDYLSKQVAIDLLREFAFNANTRTNRNSINASKMDILYEVDGDSSSMKKSGLSYQLENSLKALQVSTEGIDRVCLPCVNHGIKYRTV